MGAVLCCFSRSHHKLGCPQPACFLRTRSEAGKRNAATQLRFVALSDTLCIGAAAVLQSQQHGALCRLWIPSPCNAAIERPGGQSSGPVMVRNGKATGSRLATAARMCTWRLGSLPH
ncbi:hypothetical protein HYE67_002450 [Fusarium culmorum]|uniref:Uncharacterized protein n=1 Tax=Fusarium culmorum TaxID=5516 RepID=A0A2T4GW96_FUSCU|nr:hypothetical protein FCULG_00006680 [Fusarium culmorum]QPC60219.1 hypothetical protein HYE67_002450 [Fusarium culmorum]